MDDLCRPGLELMMGTMQLGLDQLRSLPRYPRAVTVGNFDGVHIGHQFLLRVLRDKTGDVELPVCAVTFHPHPATVVAPDRAPQLLCSLEERMSLLRRYGANEVIVLRFDDTFSQLSAEDFARLILREAMQSRIVAIGENFRFGYQQQGDLTSLRELGKLHGFEVEGAPLVHVRGLAASSSTIRRLVREGAVNRAARLLGRTYFISGDIIAGRGVGSKQTVPTLNLVPGDALLPADGVYITRVADPEAGVTYPAITNIGYRPTFQDGHPERTVESFVLGALVRQPENIRLEFLRRVREERKFESPEALRAQILRDVATAQAYHRRVLKWQPGPMAIMQR